MNPTAAIIYPGNENYMRNYLLVLFAAIISVIECSSQSTKKELHSPKKTNTNYDTFLKTGWYNISASPNTFKRQLDKDTISFYIDPTPIITAKNIKNLNLYEYENSEIGLTMEFDKNGTLLWKYWTNKAVGGKLAFIINDILVYTPTVVSEIAWGKAALNRGIYSKAELEFFKETIDKERK